MSITVLKPGLLSSFQNVGRDGFQHQGVPVAGAMDTAAHQLANALVGNTEDLATLEITLLGPALRFDNAACFALAGADLGATLNHEAIAQHRPLIAQAGDVLRFGSKPPKGVRTYLAIHGGYAIPSVMASQSTYLRSGFGGYEGRALQKNDHIALVQPLRNDSSSLRSLAAQLAQICIYIPAALHPRPRTAIRVLPGLQWAEFDQASHTNFLNADFTVSAQSDRMGYRLGGPRLQMHAARQMLSEATCFGTIQVPASGEAIILMADRQTTGGYPKLAQVASVDLPLLAQIAPGGVIRFMMIELEQAQQLDAQRASAFIQLQAALQPLRALLDTHLRTAA